MRLKSLELVGFKSFLEPTTIDFAAGVTAVVGPNGCGKSNVVDAVRWVLGEQAPTRLRGKSAEDLIYAGNDQNPAAGMAEVSLVLEADDGGVLPQPYDSLCEVAVTRRVYRSGDSEYLINKIPCRLKDITEFFMAAQIHARGYALIEQGRIEEIIQAKPDELRSMIEEAAGLSLFKGRREMSERKLERVRENLARLNDVLAEIDRQLNYARRQAKKAEQFRIIKAELSELERFAAARRLIAERETLAAETAREDDLRESIAAARRTLAALQSEVETASAAAQAARAGLGATERELENLQAGAAERERTREFLKRRLASIAELEPALTARIAVLAARATLARAARADAGARLARELAAGEGAGEQALAVQSARLESAQSELGDAQRRAEELKDELSDAVREAAVIRGRLGDLAGERAELEQRAAAAASEAPVLADRAALAAESVAAAESGLETLREEIVVLDSAHRAAAETEVEARTALEHLAARIETLKNALDARDRAGDSSAAAAAARLRTVLASLNGDRPATDPAWLRDVLRAPAPLTPALDAVLGDELESVIVQSPQFALRAIEILKETRAGRLSFVQAPDVPVAAHPSIDASGIAGRLIDMIEIDPGFAPVAEMLLGHVIVADDLDAALAASNLNGRGTLFVTRDGDLLEPGRLIRGGSSGDGAAGDDAVAPASAELARAGEDHRAVAGRFETARADRERAEAALAELRARARELERELSESRSQLALAEQARALAEARLSGARRRLAEIAEAAAASNARLEELALVEQDARARLAAVRDEHAALHARAEQLGAAVMEAAARVEARKSEVAALERDHHHGVETAAQLEAQIDENRRSLERSQVERADFERELENLAAQDGAARARETELGDARVRLGDECAARESELESRRVTHRGKSDRLAELESEATQCGLRRERARTLSEELGRGFIEKFAVAFDEAAAELVPALEGREAARDDERLTELRARAERIGEVNLAAEGEVRELEVRGGVLGREKADLESAVADLSQTITKLNREARKRFSETFEGAARNFAELFPKLMRGGRARLELAEGGDILEAGVHILVQPAGKKVKEIGLLSGGEKALSAMALVFSLFLLNPSPFCVMDEVDAPLDEFSLARFTDLVAELKDRSQFIVITHNQRTMQRADQIHGVTMDRPGISKVISLKIPQAA
jgi:chromosome segregation protein